MIRSNKRWLCGTCIIISTFLLIACNLQNSTAEKSSNTDSFSRIKAQCNSLLSDENFIRFSNTLFEETIGENGLYVIDYSHVWDIGVPEEYPLYRPADVNDDLGNESELPNKQLRDAFSSFEASYGKGQPILDFLWIKVNKEHDSIIFYLDVDTYLVRGNPFDFQYVNPEPFTYHPEYQYDPNVTWHIDYARLMDMPEVWYVIQFNIDVLTK